MFSTGAVSREAEDAHLTTGNEQQLKRAGGVLDWGLPSLLKWVGPSTFLALMENTAVTDRPKQGAANPGLNTAKTDGLCQSRE